MSEKENQTGTNIAENIQNNRTEIIEALEQLKYSDDSDNEFYEGLREKQKETIEDLEAMMKREEKES